jgi:hypothetical protein
MRWIWMKVCRGGLSGFSFGSEIGQLPRCLSPADQRCDGLNRPESAGTLMPQINSLLAQFASLLAGSKFPVLGCREFAEKTERGCGFFGAKNIAADPKFAEFPVFSRELSKFRSWIEEWRVERLIDALKLARASGIPVGTARGRGVQTGPRSNGKIGRGRKRRRMIGIES